MEMKTNFAKTSKQGFTLIEILVVIGIIAILASIFFVGRSAFIKSANDTKDITTMRQIQTQLELYYSKHRNYPATLLALGADLGINVPKKTTGADFDFVSGGACAGGDQEFVLYTTLNSANTSISEPPNGCGVACTPDTVLCFGPEN